MIDFYGNNQALSFIENTLEGSRLHHAYIIYGQNGSGKRTLARYFAKGILCGDDHHPCGECSSCKKIENNTHPDFTSLGGQGGKNSFHVNEVRKLRSDAYILPNEGKHKIFLLENIENMSISAANSLLKILEEPPEHVVFLLTCSELKSIPSTIVSRCIPVPLYPVSRTECITALQKLSSSTEADLMEQAAALSGGVIGRALDLLNNEGDKKALQISFEILRGLTDRSELDIIIAMGALENNRELTEQVLFCLNELFCLALESKYNEKEHIAIPDNLSQAEILEIIELVKTCQSRLEYNGNLKINLTWLSSSIGKCLQN